MSIPDKAVEAAAQRQAQLDGRETWELMDLEVILRYRANARAGLEAAEPYLTGGESALRQALEKHLAFMNGSPTVSVGSIRGILAAHPEVES